MADSNELVKTVIEVLHDGARGYADLGQEIKNPELKTFFIEESNTRAQFAREVQSSAGITEDIGGTTAGSIHRIWGDLKGKLGGSDHTLLETAEQGEDVAKKAYKEALESNDLDSSVRSTLERQQPHIQAAHNKVKAYRDSTK